MSEELDVAEAVVVEPGDTLLLRIGGHVSMEHAHQVRESAMRRLPLLADVVVFGCDQMAIFRPSKIEIVPLEPKVMKRRS